MTTYETPTHQEVSELLRDGLLRLIMETISTPQDYTWLLKQGPVRVRFEYRSVLIPAKSDIQQPHYEECEGTLEQETRSHLCFRGLRTLNVPNHTGLNMPFLGSRTAFDVQGRAMVPKSLVGYICEFSPEKPKKS